MNGSENGVLTLILPKAANARTVRIQLGRSEDVDID